MCFDSAENLETSTIFDSFLEITKTLMQSISPRMRWFGVSFVKYMIDSRLESNKVMIDRLILKIIAPLLFNLLYEDADIKA